jgi:hypothetical protein
MSDPYFDRIMRRIDGTNDEPLESIIDDMFTDALAAEMKKIEEEEGVDDATLLRTIRSACAGKVGV